VATRQIEKVHSIKIIIKIAAVKYLILMWRIKKQKKSPNLFFSLRKGHDPTSIISLSLFFYSFCLHFLSNFDYVTFNHTHTSNTIFPLLFLSNNIWPTNNIWPSFPISYLSHVLFCSVLKLNSKKYLIFRESERNIYQKKSQEEINIFKKFSSFFAFRFCITKIYAFFWKSNTLLLTDLVLFVFLALR
jgi:hypothetical protein